VEWLCERLQEEHGLQVKVWCDRTAKPLDEEIKVALFQVVRELLVNIAKHAAASMVEVSVGNAEGKLKIIVKDDGAGFEVARAKAQKDKKCGFGLFNIRQKMVHLGGEMAVESEIGYGTQVTLLAPLKRVNKE
jgi:signal transduction histidine kinase